MQLKYTFLEHIWFLFLLGSHFSSHRKSDSTRKQKCTHFKHLFLWFLSVCCVSQARCPSWTSATNHRRSAPNSKWVWTEFSCEPHIKLQESSLSVCVCVCFRAAYEPCCTIRSETRTRTLSSSLTSWSPCRSKASSTRTWVRQGCLYLHFTEDHTDQNWFRLRVGPESVWRWAAARRLGSVFRKACGRVSDRRAVGLSGLWAASDGCQGHQTVTSATLSRPFLSFDAARAHSSLSFPCRFILHAKKTAFVVEHDFIMATYLADRVIVFDGIPSKNTNANAYVLHLLW